MLDTIFQDHSLLKIDTMSYQIQNMLKFDSI